MEGRTVNFGGLHHGPGREKVLSYLHLSPSDIEDIGRMVDAGVRVQARDLPDAPRVDLAQALDLA
jgi:mannose/fructose/N-acetylgalactosamine-specific phosphotransferase system component IIB